MKKTRMHIGMNLHRIIDTLADCVSSGFQEQLLDWDLDLPKNTIVQSWLSAQSVAQIVKKGYQTIAGAYQLWYLDCGQGEWLDFYPGKDSKQNW